MIDVASVTDAPKRIVISAEWKPGMTIEQLERHVIILALSYFKGNKLETADSLGISIRTLRNKLNKYMGKK